MRSAHSRAPSNSLMIRSSARTARTRRRARACRRSGRRWPRHISARLSSFARKQARRHDRARIAAALGGVLYLRGSTDEGLELMEEAFSVLAEDERDADVAALAAQLGRLHFFSGNRRWQRSGSSSRSTSRRSWACRVFSQARSTRRASSSSAGRASPRRSCGRRSPSLSRPTWSSEALRAFNNILVALDSLDRVEEMRPVTRGGARPRPSPRRPILGDAHGGEPHR